MYADWNPQYPGKGEMPWAIFRKDYGTPHVKLAKQFRSRKRAQAYAYDLQVKHDRHVNRTVDLGD